MPLRGWQVKAKDEVQKAWANGVKCPTVVAATGSGKTRLAAALISEFEGKAVFTAHRDQLISQTSRAFLENIEGRSIGIVRAADNQVHADVVVASLQTLASGNRLDQLLAAGKRELVIADEAHMSGSTMFFGVFKRLGLQSRSVFGLGLSATLARTTGTPLHELWDDPVYTMSLKEAIEDGICVPPAGIRVHMPEGKMSLLEGASEAAAWTSGSAAALEATDAPGIIATAIKEHCGSRAVVGFAPNVRAALVLADACRDLGISSEVITANTPAAAREDAFQRSESGELRCIWSVDTISVGADLPWVSALVVARDTTSRVWFTQALGRGLRTHPGKEDCLVLDCSSSSARLVLDTFYDLGRSVDGDEREPSSASADADVADLASLPPVHVGRVEYSGFDFFARELNWLTTIGGIRFIPAYGSVVFVAPDTEGTFSVGSIPDSVWSPSKPKRHVRDVDLDTAVRVAEAVADRLDSAAPVMYGKRMSVARSDAAWRGKADPPTQGQEKMLRKLRASLVERSCLHLGIKPGQLNKAKASTAISVAIASAIMSRLGFDDPI